MKLKDHVYIVTGATSGMGKATAILFAKHGAKLVVNGRNIERGNLLLEELKQITTDVIFHSGNVALPEVNKHLVDLAIENYGKLTGIITNAGVLGLGSITDISIKDWHTTLDQISIPSFIYVNMQSLI